MAVRGRKPKRRSTKEPVGIKKKATRSLDPIMEILDDDTAEQELVRLVKDMVPFQGFLNIHPPLEVRQYRALRNLATLEMLFHLSDDEICGRLTIDSRHLVALRANPHYGLMRERVGAVIEKLASPRKLAEWATDSEDSLSYKMILTALYDGSTRDRTQAMNSLLDRISSKKGREGEGESPPGMPTLPVDILKLIEMSLNFGAAAARTGAAPFVIDGSVLNVPRQIGPGDESN